MTTTEKIIAGIVLILIFFVAYQTYHLSKYVEKHGLKSVVNEIWEGKKK